MAKRKSAAKTGRKKGNSSPTVAIDDAPVYLDTESASPLVMPGSDAGVPFTLVPAGDAFAQRRFGPQHVFENQARRGLGWLRDTPDIRDMTLAEAAPRLKRDKTAITAFRKATDTITAAAGATSLPSRVDSRRFCSRIEDQGALGSCTAHACVGMVEYMERRASGKHIDGSRLFVYKTTRKLLGWTGDTGAFLRTTMKALVHFGIPPEDYWPYDIANYEAEPDPFLYAFALNCRAVNYMRLDPNGSTTEETLASVKGAVATGYAVMFGFSVYSSLSSAADIPFPAPSDSLEGGHAVLIVGYDDERPNKGPLTGSAKKGAFLIRNSWGPGWGAGGYGWLPYEYVRSGLADDFWTCFKLEWVESGQFD